jgi:hypothetical protein
VECAQGLATKALRIEKGTTPLRGTSAHTQKASGRKSHPDQGSCRWVGDLVGKALAMGIDLLYIQGKQRKRGETLPTSFHKKRNNRLGVFKENAAFGSYKLWRTDPISFSISQSYMNSSFAFHQHRIISNISIAHIKTAKEQPCLLFISYRSIPQ